MNPQATPRVRPSGWWYLVPTALAAVGCALCVLAVVRGFGDARDAALDASAAAPGVDQTLTITRPGGYTLAYSGPILVRNTSQQRELAEQLQLSIEPAGGGAPLTLRPYDGLNDFEEAGQQYMPLLTVRFGQPGDYVLRSAPPPTVDRERAALVLSESPFRKLRSGAERAVVILAVGLGLALLVLVILARTRGRAKEAIRALHPPPAPWPPTWPAAPGPGPGQWPPGPSPGQWPGPSGSGSSQWSGPSGPGPGRWSGQPGSGPGAPGSGQWPGQSGSGSGAPGSGEWPGQSGSGSGAAGSGEWSTGAGQRPGASSSGAGSGGVSGWPSAPGPSNWPGPSR